MSWLTDLAGRAEELLNKVDQSAAVALKKEEEGLLGAGRSRSVTPPVRNIGHVLTPRAFVSAPSSSASLPPTTTRPVESTPPSKAKSKKQLEEEKLFEFLNSSADTSKTVTTKDDIASSNSIIRVDNADVIFRSGTAEDQYVDITAPLPQSAVPGSFASTVTATVTDEIGTVSESVVDVGPDPLDQSTSKVGSLELENRLLHSEIASLNRELKQSLHRTQNLEAELRTVQERLNTCTAEGASEAQIAREYRERESDLRSALEAKDSQLAVLRVRLDEADHELVGKREALDRLAADNRRILEDYSNSSGLHGQTIQAAQDRLQQAEELLERERVHFRSFQVESGQRISRLEEEVSTLASNFGETKSNLEEERSRSGELAGQLRTARHSLESVQQELTDYKTKAQWILQSKERLIASLKESAGVGAPDGIDNNGKAAAAAFVQLEELRQERDLLKEDLVKSGRHLEQLRVEMRDVESQLQSELEGSRECGREMDERLKEERRRREDGEQEAAQLRDEVRYLREDGSQQRVALQSRLGDRDAEIERLRKQLVIRQVNGGGSAVVIDGRGEMEAKMNALTENLIQKQTMLETLSTEKNSLVFQLERTELQLKEQSLHSRRNASMAVSVNDDSDVKQRVAGFMAETPFDGQVTRKVKRVYNTIDMFSFRLGIFLRRYPMARVLIILYMVLLHFWVLVVLLTYSPEIHDKDCSAPNGKR